MINIIKRTIAGIFKNIFFRQQMKIYNSLVVRGELTEIEKRQYQQEKLIKVLNIARKSIPYYKEVLKFNEGNFQYNDFLNISPLTKDIIRNEGERLCNKDFSDLNNVIRNTSGGSTGEPLEFFRTREQARHGAANYYYALYLNRVNINDISIDLWGAERDMHNNSKRLSLRSVLYNKISLNTFVLSDDIIRDYISRMNHLKPKFIKAYVHSIFSIAQYINKNKISIKFNPVIHCTTGPLYPEMREEIQKAFNGARVYNFYGSREVSAIASEVQGKNGLYVFYDNVFVEILNRNGEPVDNGEEGEIVITTLNNYYMPLIRYKIGDRAVKGDDSSVGTLKLDAVVGRTLGVIHKADGSKIDGQFFTTLFFNRPGIKGFQLVQKSISSLTLNIVKSNIFEERELEEILNRIAQELPEVEIEVVFCDTINLTRTGKIMYVYSELEYTN